MDCVIQTEEKSDTLFENVESTCRLCRNTINRHSGLCSISSADRLLIDKCLGIEVNPIDDKDALICVDCAGKLQSCSWIYHQARSNDSFLKNLSTDYIPAKEYFCRLCLTACTGLAIFPEGVQQNSVLWKIIKECLGININFYQEFNSHICAACRTSLEMFAIFKRLCKQINIQNVICAESDNDSDELEIMEVESEPVENVKKNRRSKYAGNTRKDVFRMLRMTDDERNFEVVREFGGRSLIRIYGYNFYQVRTSSDGSSVWHCEWKLLHNCKLSIHLGADTKIATFNKSMTHCHEAEPVQLLKCPSGKAFFTKRDGTKEPFWLVSRSKGLFEKTYKRNLIYEEQQYTLRNMNIKFDLSYWMCTFRSCRVTLRIEGIFSGGFSQTGTHEHPKLTESEINEIIRANDIRDKNDKITQFRNNVKPRYPRATIKRMRMPGIYAKLAIKDVRNFDVLMIRENLCKIRYLGHSYKYYLRTPAGSTIWKCIWESIHNCSALVTISSDCKHASQYGSDDHCHSVNSADIFNCKLKNYSVRRITTQASEIIQLLSRECCYFESRSIISQNQAYNLCRIIDNYETRWSCVRQPCPASLIVNGQFDSFFLKGVHCHPPMTSDEKKRLVKQKRRIDLSALELGEEAAERPTIDESHPDTLKEQLLTSPMGRGTIWDSDENANVPFFFFKDDTKKDDNPHKVLYQQYRYSFASIDAYGTSQWVCSQLLENNAEDSTCTAHLTIEGVFQRLATKGSHNHAGVSESTVDVLFNNGEHSPEC